MKTKYYKTIKPVTAKARIANLVEAHNEAWEKLRNCEKCGGFKGDSVYDYRLAEAITFSQALRTMGVTEVECLSD